MYIYLYVQCIKEVSELRCTYTYGMIFITQLLKAKIYYIKAQGQPYRLGKFWLRTHGGQ
jgi:hypothetical protein